MLVSPYVPLGGGVGWIAKAAMLCLETGEEYAAQHNPDYDFLGDFTPIDAAIFERNALDVLV